MYCNIRMHISCTIHIEYVLQIGVTSPCRYLYARVCVEQRKYQEGEEALLSLLEGVVAGQEIGEVASGAVHELLGDIARCVLGGAGGVRRV